MLSCAPFAKRIKMGTIIIACSACQALGLLNGALWLAFSAGCWAPASRHSATVYWHCWTIMPRWCAVFSVAKGKSPTPSILSALHQYSSGSQLVLMAPQEPFLSVRLLPSCKNNHSGAAVNGWISLWCRSTRDRHYCHTAAAVPMRTARHRSRQCGKPSSRRPTAIRLLPWSIFIWAPGWYLNHHVERHGLLSPLCRWGRVAGKFFNS